MESIKTEQNRTWQSKIKKGKANDLKTRAEQNNTLQNIT